jgi:hypothetical protein
MHPPHPPPPPSFHNSKDGFSPVVKNLKHMNKVIIQLGLPKVKLPFMSISFVMSQPKN